MAGSDRLERPAFYALRPGGVRDLVTLLHVPYTAWHLSYVAFGAAAAPVVHGDRLLATLVAFFLAVGVSAHALDELNGRPLRTTLSTGVLIGLALVSLAGAFLVAAYTLELFGGRFHSDWWFAAAWGAFPALTAYWINALELRPAGLLVAAGCFLLSAAQRRLSTPVRELRRRTVAVSGVQHLADGTTVELDASRLAAPLDDALRACALALPLLAAGLVIARL